MKHALKGWLREAWARGLVHLGLWRLVDRLMPRRMLVLAGHCVAEEASNGGLLTANGRVNLTNCTFLQGTARKGGCLSNYVGHLHATNCVFDTCVSSDGGAVLNHGMMVLVNA